MNRDRKAETIDCLIIGHNEMVFMEYEKSVRKMGIHSGAYRDLNLSFIQYKNQLFHASGIFNLFHSQTLRLGEVFSPAVAYLGTYLDRRGFTFDYVNSFQDEKEELAKKLQQENITAVAITTTLYVSVLPILEIMQFIKKNNQSAKIIIGGPFIATQVRLAEPITLAYLFETIGADFYVNSSQGEATLVKLIHAQKHRLSLDNINNIFYKTADQYSATPILKENNKLSENMVDWNLFSDRLDEYANIRTSISCPFSCAFCGFPEHAGEYQTIDIDTIKSELDLLAKIKTTRSVYFIDDTLNIPVKRFKEMLRMMIKNNYGFRWQSNFRCQYSDREMVQLMKESGCEGVFLGIESGNNQILKNMNKSANIKKYREGIELLKEQGIVTFGSFIIGFPGETDDTVKDTIRFIRESGIDFYRTQLWYCEPITPIWREREKYNIKGENFEWIHTTMTAKKASDWIYEIFLTIKESTWIPQYNFDFGHIFHLTNRGMTLEQVTDFLIGFNNGVEEKIRYPVAKQVSEKVIKQIRRSLGQHDPIVDETNGPIEEEEDELLIDFNLD